MAGNNRLFSIRGLVFNAEAVGGTGEISFDADYADVIESLGDGADGAEDVDRAGLRVAWNLALTDVSKVNALLAATVGDTTFSGKESGAANYRHYTVPGLVATGMRLSLPKAAEGQLTINGLTRFADGTKTLADVFAAATDPNAPALTYPARLYRPYGASFAADPVIAPDHLESIELALAAQETLDAYGDTDIGHTAVDRGPWGALEVTLTFWDYSLQSGSDMCAKLIDSSDRAALTATLIGRAGAANKTLTVNNVLWTGSSKRKVARYWQWTAKGRAAWKAGATTYQLNTGTKLFSIE